jgi:ABC-type uncharacterized transport system permease subunit
MPNSQSIQLALLLLTSLLFAAAFVLGLRHMRRSTAGEAHAGRGGCGRDAGRVGGLGGVAGVGALPHEASMGPQARAAVIVGTLVGMGIFAWRAVAEQTLALPVSNPFDAFLALGLLLALVLMYFRWTRHLRSFSFFLLPMVVILLLIGALLSLIHRDEGHSYVNAWTFIHIISIFAGTICFVLGCVGGVIYLLQDRQLRRKGLDKSHRWVGLPPLASLEKFNQWMIYVGFPLLTIATITGILRIAQAKGGGGGGGGDPGQQSLVAAQHLKIAFGSLSWAVYAVLLHVPLNPRFRGPRAAWLSILGFVLFIGAFVAARWN